MARRLVGAWQSARAAAGQHDDVDSGSRTRITGAVAGLFALLVVIGAARFAIPRLTSSEKVEVKAPTEGDVAKQERLARACDAVRERAYKGDSFGPFALEGWVVELWLASQKGAPLRQSPALTALVAGGKLTAAADEKIAAVIDGTVELADGFDAEAAKRSPGWSAATVVFKNGYARAFLEEEHRPRFLALADRLVAASGADHGALYARCAHRTTHDIGAWFHGPDLAGATAAMVYQMGFFAEEKVIDRTALAAIRVSGGELDALRKVAGEVSSSVPRLVGTAGGSVSTSAGTNLLFSLAAPVRSVAATKDVAKKMGIGLLAGD